METKGSQLALPHKGSKTPWIFYDMFVSGSSVSEIVMQFSMRGVSEVTHEYVMADIEQMRSFECERNPGALLTDQDCDQLRNLYLKITACFSDGSGGALKTANDLEVRRGMIILAAQQRYEE